MFFKFLSAVALIAAVASAHAQDSGEKAVRDAMHSLLPMTQIDEVVKSDLPGFYEVIVSGQVVYVSADGKYLLQGNLYNVAQKKHTVTVFTDVDCPYCRQFHKQIAEFNRQGIAVKYILFPLDIHPGADKKAVAVWCSPDRNTAYTAAMNGQDPGTGTCVNNPVSETKALAIAMGINATPTVLAEDGTQVDLGRASSPAALAAELDRLAAAAKTTGTPVASR
jgi:thiol:disulfide interchange protein DsbC